MTPLSQKPNPYAQYGFIPDSKAPPPPRDDQNANPYAEYGFIPDAPSQTQAPSPVPIQEATHQPSWLDQAKRVAGVAAHGFSEGVGNLADIAAIAEQRNTPEGLPLPGQQTAKQEVQPILADYLGKKVNDLFGTDLTPQDAFERFIHLAGELSVPIPGLGLAGGGAKAVSAGIKGLAKGLLKHEALAAGGAAGITAAEEAGVESALGKLAAGMGGTAAVSSLGAVNPKKALLNLAGFGNKHLKQKALDAAQRIGVDLPGVAATDAVLPSHAHNLISKVPYFGDKIREALVKTGQQYQQSFETLLNKVSPPLEDELSKIAKRLYAPLEGLLPSSDTLDPTPWLKEIKNLETKLKSVAPSDPTKKLFSIFKDVKKSLSPLKEEELVLPEYLSTASETVKKSLEKQLQGEKKTVQALPVSEVVQQKIEFNKMMKDKNLFDRTDTDSLSYLHRLQAVTKGMLEKYGTHENPAFLNALKKADLEYGAYARRESLEDLLGEQIKTLTTEQPNYNQLIKTLQKKHHKKMLKNALGKENYKQLQDYVEVAKAMDSLKRNNLNPSGSGYIGALASLMGGLYTAPAYTVGLLGLLQGGRTLLTSKRFINLAHRYAKQPSPSLAQKLETVIKDTTGKSSGVLTQELAELQKRKQAGEETP